MVLQGYNRTSLFMLETLHEPKNKRLFGEVRF